MERQCCYWIWVERKLSGDLRCNVAPAVLRQMALTDDLDGVEPVLEVAAVPATPPQPEQVRLTGNLGVMVSLIKLSF